MNQVIKILIERDSMTKEDATELLNEVREMIAECNYAPVETEEIIASELGLEPDYIFDILEW